MYIVCIPRPESTQTAYQEALPAASGVHSVPWKCLGSASTALSRVPPPLLTAAPVEACSVPQGRPNGAQPSVVGRVETQIIFTQFCQVFDIVTDVLSRVHQCADAQVLVPEQETAIISCLDFTLTRVNSHWEHVVNLNDSRALC